MRHLIPVILLLTACQDRDLGAMLTSSGTAERIDSTHVSLTDTKQGLEIEISLGIDPICNAIDDEYYYDIDLIIADIDDVPLNTDIDLSDAKGPVQPHFDIACFCPKAGEDPDAVYSGTVRFSALSQTAASFDIDLTFRGDTTFDSDQDVSLVASYDAPVHTESRCL